MVEEIRLHGTGGQGVVAAGELIAIAASYEDKFCRAFPMYGSARRGAPVVAFAQIGEESEATRSMIYYPKYLIIMDPLMPMTIDVTSGLVKGGMIIYNTPQPPEEAAKIFKVSISKIGMADANKIAEKIIGRPIPNTVMLGVFAKTTGLLKLDSINKAILKRFEGEVAERNIQAAKSGYDLTRIKNFDGVL
ncbi:MAG: 2-oxoacid:acceptor oxidoreductase family protein [Candidatus Bathyarchaeia archaeon]